SRLYQEQKSSRPAVGSTSSTAFCRPPAPEHRQPAFASQLLHRPPADNEKAGECPGFFVSGVGSVFNENGSDPIGIENANRGWRLPGVMRVNQG
ncbi:TPA: hypothetical protein ACKP7X_003587, partial [Stenotrophomonas maltophilia]